MLMMCGISVVGEPGQIQPCKVSLEQSSERLEGQQKCKRSSDGLN